MQKEIFDKFISKLEKHCEIISIGSEVDYRRVAAKNSVEHVRIFHSLYIIYLLLLFDEKNSKCELIGSLLMAFERWCYGRV